MGEKKRKAKKVKVMHLQRKEKKNPAQAVSEKKRKRDFPP